MKISTINRLRISCLASIILFNSTAYSQAVVPTKAIPVQSQTISATGVQQNLQNLLETHGVLLNQAILAALTNAPADVMEQGKRKLLDNAHEIAKVLVAVNGPQAAQQFETLFDEHIALGSNYINAIKAKDLLLANQVADQATMNGRMIAQFLGQLFPSVPLDVWQKMLDEHVMIEARQTVAYFNRDPQAALLRDQSLLELRQLANLIAGALQSQASPRL